MATDDPELGAVGGFGFRLPAEELAGNFEGNDESEGEGKHIGDHFWHASKWCVDGGLESGGQISGRQKERYALNPVREDCQRHGGAGKKQERRSRSDG